MCNQLMMYPEIFKKSFIDICTTLASDKVVNVRISLAHTIASHIKAKGIKIALFSILEMYLNYQKVCNSKEFYKINLILQVL